jgi:hypothetical protein
MTPMSAYAEAPTATVSISNNDAIRACNGIFASRDEHVVLFALVVTFCSCPHSLHFFFNNGVGDGSGGYQKYFTLSTIVNVSIDMQTNCIHIAMAAKTKAKKVSAAFKKHSLAAKKGWVTRRKNAAKPTSAKKPRR